MITSKQSKLRINRMQHEEAILSCELPKARGFIPRRKPLKGKRDEENVIIRVRNPRTHIAGGKALYTDYKIEVKTNNKAFHYCQSCVRRRYSEFEWLWRRLSADYMGSTPPTLPAKKLIGRFKPEFLRERQKQLQEFLDSVVSDVLYLSNKSLHLFLQSNLPVSQIEHYLDHFQCNDFFDVMLLANTGNTDMWKTCDSAFDSSYSGYDVEEPALSVDESDLIGSGYFADDEVFHGDDADHKVSQVCLRVPSSNSTMVPSTFDNIMHRVDSTVTPVPSGHTSSSSSDEVIPTLNKSTSRHSLNNVIEFSFNLSEQPELDSGQGTGSESYVVLGRARRANNSALRTRFTVDTYDVISISYDGSSPNAATGSLFAQGMQMNQRSRRPSRA